MTRVLRHTPQGNRLPLLYKTNRGKHERQDTIYIINFNYRDNLRIIVLEEKQ